ncbi:NACHT, LRR and PYD domains-containing protein 3-like [Mantella aurantiaca]
MAETLVTTLVSGDFSISSDSPLGCPSHTFSPGGNPAADCEIFFFIIHNCAKPAPSGCFAQCKWTNEQTSRDLILYSLENLKEYDFKRFRDKLSDFSYGSKLPISKGKLENADCITTKDLLIDTYGEEQALDVTTKVFTLINLMGPANNLQERRTQNGFCSSHAEWRKRYMESMKKNFQRIKEHNTPRGNTASLETKYNKVQLRQGPQIIDENMHEILNSGRRNLHILKKNSDDFPLTIQMLFDPDEHGFTPEIVVLQGPAGIGKTWTSRKMMLDWASGNLYQEKFDFVFHLSCRELNNINGNIKLVGLLYRTCKLQCSDELVSILEDPDRHRKLLFIVDGFDEFRWTLEEESEVCHDPFEETHKDLLLQRLLRKQVLKDASLIITTRPLALGKLHSFVDDARHVEVLGFTKKDHEKYFYNFFRNKSDAEKALRIIKENDILNTMCAVPIVCWIVCTVMKIPEERDMGSMQYKTVTSIYLLYLKALIKHHARSQPVHICLKKLCALAKEGILNQKILFEMEDLDRHGLSLSEVESVFLNESIFQKDIDTEFCYSFIHLSVQEFLAALYYVLDDGAGNEEGTTGLREGTSISEICKGSSFSATFLGHKHLKLTLQFLFGLFNEKEVTNFSTKTGIKISLPDKRAMEKWLVRELGDRPRILSFEVISCLYETQDKDMIRRNLTSELKIYGTCYDGFWTGKNYSQQLYYCLTTRARFQSLSFIDLTLDPRYLTMLSSLLHRCHQLSFQNVKVHCEDSLEEDKLPQCNEVPETSANLSWLTRPQSNITSLKFSYYGLTALSCNYICSFMRKNKLLTSLDLSDNNLGDQGVNILCRELKDLSCALQELRIQECKLSPSCCDDLRSLLITHRSLTSLDLSTNDLMDSGIKLLCEGLRDPHCNLQDLNIQRCGLTHLSCDDLRSVLIANRSLSKLNLTMNNLEDSGIKLICEGLKHPDCTLQELRCEYCQVTSLCLEDVYSAISTNRTLRTLEIRFDEESLESNRYFTELKPLGCTVTEFSNIHENKSNIHYMRSNIHDKRSNIRYMRSNIHGNRSNIRYMRSNIYDNRVRPLYLNIEDKANQRSLLDPSATMKVQTLIHILTDVSWALLQNYRYREFAIPAIRIAFFVMHCEATTSNTLSQGSTGGMLQLIKVMESPTRMEHMIFANDDIPESMPDKVKGHKSQGKIVVQNYSSAGGLQIPAEPSNQVCADSAAQAVAGSALGVEDSMLQHQGSSGTAHGGEKSQKLWTCVQLTLALQKL